MLLTIATKYPFIPAFLLGIIPALVWLWFWLKEDRHPEPARMITLSFLGGMLSVALVLPVQQLIFPFFENHTRISFVIFATLEELFKFTVVYFVALRNKLIDDEPVDNMIYLIVSALGFVALENSLFLMGPIRSGDIIGTVITGNMRFIGASLVHIASSGAIGTFMALSFYKSKSLKKIYLLSGILSAVILHSSFNLFIIDVQEKNILLVFSAVWIGIVVMLSLFEKIKNLKVNP